jgi:cell division septation protein DedD
MGGYWLNIIGILCGLAMIGCALAFRYRPNPAWRVLLIALSVILVATAVASIRQSMHRDDRAARYAHIGAEQADVKRRIDALQAEITNSKGPVDPSVAKDRRERLEALQRDLDAIRKESDDLKSSGAAK